MTPKYLGFTVSRKKDVRMANSAGTSRTTTPLATTLTMANSVVALEGLHPKAQDELLNMIDSLRFEGLDTDLSLPQLVVCGDQSSGKSSVLEAIAEIPFPRKENLCTRFATEIILRRKKHPLMTCKIIPDKTRPEEEQKLLSNQKMVIRHTGELPDIIDQATKLMGLDDAVEGKGAFSKDILRIEVEGPGQPHLTLVDLPGLIHSENKLQTTADVEVIGTLVNKYINNPRTIILPVVSAKNDIANQIILKKARDVDPDGRRTLGIITKPDDLSRGSESEKSFINLAKNENVSFALGWHVLRNRNTQEMNTSFLDRERKEEQFFAITDWSQLPVDNLGVASLRSRLSALLYQHIKQELPNLRKELDAILTKTADQLRELGKSRATVQEQRLYLTELSVKFHELTRSAANGLYDHAYFDIAGTPMFALLENSNRLCAIVASSGLEFAEMMNKHGHKYSFNNRHVEASQPRGVQFVNVGGKKVEICQKALTANESMSLVKRLLSRNRGTELPGSFNPRLIGELYQIQSQNWGTLAVHRVAHIAAICESFCSNLRNHLAPKATLNSYLDEVLNESLSMRLQAAEDELNEILKDEKCPPLTFNHYYTLTIQRSRVQKRKRAAAELDAPIRTPASNDKRQKTGNQTPELGVPGAMSGFSGNTDSAAASRTQTINNSVATPTENRRADPVFEDWEVETDTGVILMDMDEHSCRDALEALQSYYKVARKTFIDNIEKQVIRRHLINGLENIFSPVVVASWSEAEISMAAAEPKATISKRQDLEGRLERLKKGIEVFKKAERMAV